MSILTPLLDPVPASPTSSTPCCSCSGSAKKLRLNKISELIHSSDSCRSDPPGYAKVSVHLHEIIDTGDGDDDYEVVYPSPAN